jgi:hypothetical protein
MRNIYIALVFTTIFSMSAAFADRPIESKSCAAVAKACKVAGFTKGDQSNKKFWFNCMKPIILGQTVQGVTIDTTTVKACRTDKIAALKHELKELQNAS